jgi:DNA-binding beta-propeller fold protein YncE
VYVVDRDNDRIDEFTPNGTYLAKFGEPGSGNGQFKFPQGVAVDASGDVYVTDTFQNRVEVFNSTGSYLGQFGSAGTGNGQFEQPFGIAVSPTTGEVYVVDSDNERVERFG